MKRTFICLNVSLHISSLYKTIGIFVIRHHAKIDKAIKVFAARQKKTTKDTLLINVGRPCFFTNLCYVSLKVRKVR